MKPICDQQFLGEAQSSTAEYLGVFEERRQASTPKLPFSNRFQKGSTEKQIFSLSFLCAKGLYRRP
ncbi:MAG: hypothetical protein NMK33_00725 [Candidatus Cardinium sp.]|uniref:hypothetical protein n=1 Tax=Cardinium endosymbiont of Dermatophagoides farinae TaxID=2597823 RepID=UPI001181F492|nr:hypothetical protein [Cardinium endosymbiont of Dermatophagoides farinae]TSJ81047.1 hypothetical protein FPG78_03400 [Cardinium endosymbiont of Dermatophagoides farinae]UWW97077.1 MAG: hypothetical protein NMK33_00725 [Candidatus Cardinium sp.]